MLGRILLASSVLWLCAVQGLAGDKANHPVKPDQLLSLVQQADKVVVYNLQVRDTGQSKVPVYTSSDAKDIAELRQALTIEIPKESFACLCVPSVGIELFHQGKQLAWIGVIEGSTIHTQIWSSDARIKDVEAWLKWFDQRNISLPREQVENERETIKRETEAEERWNKAMPNSLRPLWPQAMNRMPMRPGSADVKPLDVALEREFPEMHQRIRRLLSWYGSGAGPWSGFPAYEEFAEQMLLEYSTSDLLAAVQQAKLDEAELEGTARLFGGWEFNRSRPNDNAIIPSELKQLLLEHSLQSSYQDKVGRARMHFEQKGESK